MNKTKKLLLLFLTCVSFFFLEGCYKTDRYAFIDSTFIYEGEPVEFYNEILIEEMSIDFNEITEDDFNQRNNINVLRNYYDNKCFEVILKIKYTNQDDFITQTFEYVEKSGDRSDGYIISLNIAIPNTEIESEITLILHFFGEVGGDADIGDQAGRLNITVIENNLPQDEDNVYYGFPETLNKKKEN